MPIFKVMWIIDFLLSIITIMHLSTSSTTSRSEFKQVGLFQKWKLK